MVRRDPDRRARAAGHARALSGYDVGGGAGIGRGADADHAPPALPHQQTLGELIDAYVEHIRKNARSWALIAASLRRPEMQPLHPRPAVGLTKGELVAVVDALAASMPHAATSLLKHLKMALNFAVERDMLTANPLNKVRPPAKTTERSRVLTDKEIVAVLDACDEVPAPFGAMVRMLLYTGARRNEVGRMTWGELDGNVWTLPAERSKSKRANSLPLPPQAMAVLASLPRRGEGAFVFTTTFGRLPSSDFSSKKRLLDQMSGVTKWHLHDLRRTCRTKLSQLGVPREVARRIIGHAVEKLDQIYDLHTHAEAKAAALARLADHLAELVRATA